MQKKYDLLIIGSGPGGYVAAIKAAQLGMKVGIIEKSELGGICLNWGCIPTKALLKSAQVFDYIQHAENYGITVSNFDINFSKIIQRSRNVAQNMNKGIQFLLKKNKIDVIKGHGKLKNSCTVMVTSNEEAVMYYEAQHIILATGSKSKTLPYIPIDQKKVIGYREAMSLPKQPTSIIIIGAGAIGVEFAYFYHTIGTKVTLIEYQSNIMPSEDEEISKELAKLLKKRGINIYTNTEVVKVVTQNQQCSLTVKTNQEATHILESDIVLSAVGITANIKNIGLEEVGILSENDKVLVDDFYTTNIKGVYAIGDVIKGPALAHVASSEAIICVEKIAGHNPEKLNYNNIPACTYSQPEIASVGYTEKEAKEAGYSIRIGKFPFSASGKAHAAGTEEGFVKVIFDEKYDEWLGAHMIGHNVTEIISEVVVAKKLETTAHEIIKSIHPHPTMSEAILEAVAAAYGEVIHL